MAGSDSEDTEKRIPLPSPAERLKAIEKLRDQHQANIARAAKEAEERVAESTRLDDVDPGELTDSDRLLLDPSFLFSEEGISWLQELREPEEIIVSSAFIRWLQSGDAVEDLVDLVHQDDREEIDGRRELLLGLLQRTPTFSSDRADLEQADEEVLLALRESGGLVAEILADEWAFLQSHSWALSKVHLPLDRFRDAGAAVVEFGKRLRDQMVDVVIPQKEAPPALTPALLARASAKWLIVGGAGAGGAFLGPIGAGLSLVAVPVVRAFDP